MAYDPTERAQQPPVPSPYGQQPAQQPPAPPPYEQIPLPPTQLASGTPPAYGQSNPAFPPYQQQPLPPTQLAPGTPSAYGQSNPAFPPYQQQPLPPTQLAPGTPPAYGQSNPGLPGYGQGGSSAPNYPQYTPTAPTDPYAPPPGGGGYPPAQAWPPPAYQAPAPQKKQSGLTVLLIVLVIVLVIALGGGGTAIYFATRPQPVIHVTSLYHMDSTPAGSSSTTFSLTGQKFSGNSAITFLLDTATAPGSQTVQSDSNGNVTATLTVTDAWTIGSHMITAKDASGYTTKVGEAIAIVAQGQAHTPGPNGAPPDDASGTIAVTLQSSGQSSTTSLTLTIKGSLDGGTVCGQPTDGQPADGQPHTHRGTSSNGGYSETAVKTCSGTYKGGKLSYTETDTSDVILFDDGVRCTASTPYVDARLDGTFTSATAVNGNATSDSTTVTCSLAGQSQSTTVSAQTGTWTGSASMQ